jgi:serine/threonine-protein kinase
MNSPDTDPAGRIPENVPQSDPRIGQVLDSKYQLLECLGKGGMGTVYRARRLHIGDEVAVKVLSQELMREQIAIERFRREARSAAMIRHPNVVSIHDFSDASNVGGSNEAYIVMEFIKGRSLRHLLEREGRLSPARAASLMRDICAGVGLAHRQGLLHRDLKPDNVIVTPPTPHGDHETAKVVDFGLAKLREENVSTLTKAGILLGTIYYMSPEQCRGEELDARSDVYSLGAMLYEMLSGAPPFKATSLTGLIFQHLNDPPPPFQPSLQIPPSFALVCFRALAKSREERQSDAIALGAELKAALTAAGGDETHNTISQPLTSTSAPTLPMKRESSFWKWIIAIGGVSVLAIALVAVVLAIKFGFIQQNDTSAQNTQSQTTTKSNEGATNVTSATTTVSDLRGKWTGTYGPLKQAATLVINSHKGKEFDGVLEQGGARVAFKGTIESGKIHMKQSAVLNGTDWSLGEDTGTVSNDGKRMSGTGRDEMGGALGLTYEWSFSR